MTQLTSSEARTVGQSADSHSQIESFIDEVNDAIGE